MTSADHAACAICGKSFRTAELRPLSSLSAGVLAALRLELPDIDPKALICPAEVSRLRRIYLERLLEAERGQLSQLDREVLASVEAEATISADTDHSFDEARTFGQRAADAVASFGGSWRFILLFMAVLVAWIAVNSFGLLYQPYDPFPFILLNLVLSCIAALQAPVIMMSQRRQEAKDRKRAENDYRVNLKAELEIRHLHDKIDHQMARQWERLAAIQQMQIELLEEATRANPK